jgi:flagellar protein FlaF
MTTTTKEQYGAYASNTVATEEEVDGREIDRRALMSCAARMNIALTDGGKDMPAYIDAIRHNQRLWTLFQVGLCDADNQLPRHLKVTLLNLSRYVDRVSFRAVTEFAPQLLTSLIEINRTIAIGLVKKENNDAKVAARKEQQAMPLAPTSAVAGSVMTTA